MRKGGEAGEGQNEAGDPEGQHGSGSNTRRKRHQAEEPVGELSANVRSSGRSCQQSAKCSDYQESHQFYGRFVWFLPLFSKRQFAPFPGVVNAMDAAMRSMNLEKISNVMDKFEQQFEDLGVQTDVLENTMAQTTTTLIPQNDVDSLMQQVADEAGYKAIFWDLKGAILRLSFAAWS